MWTSRYFIKYSKILVNKNKIRKRRDVFFLFKRPKMPNIYHGIIGVMVALRPVLNDDVGRYIQNICIEKEILRIHLKKIHYELKNSCNFSCECSTSVCRCDAHVYHATPNGCVIGC